MTAGERPPIRSATYTAKDFDTYCQKRAGCPPRHSRSAGRNFLFSPYYSRFERDVIHLSVYDGATESNAASTQTERLEDTVQERSACLSRRTVAALTRFPDELPRRYTPRISDPEEAPEPGSADGPRSRWAVASGPVGVHPVKPGSALDLLQPRFTYMVGKNHSGRTVLLGQHNILRRTDSLYEDRDSGRVLLNPSDVGPRHIR